VANRDAVALGRELGGRLTFLHVLAPLARFGSTPISTGDDVKLRREEAQLQLRRWAEELGAPDAACVVAVGRYFEEIVRFADESRCDLVVMGRASESGGGIRESLGSTVEKVTRHAKCPVLVVAAPVEPLPDAADAPASGSIAHEPQRLVVTTDFSDDSLVCFPWANRLASVYGARVLLAFVEEAPTAAALPQQNDEWAVQRRKEVDAKIQDWRTQHLGPALSVEPCVVEGTPYRAICGMAREREAELIIMSTQGASGWRRTWVGGTAERVLRHSPCSVLLVPPPHDEHSPGTGEDPGGAGQTNPGAIDLQATVATIMRGDIPAVAHDVSIGQALEGIRREGVGERLVYFYVVEPDQRLVGVIPTRRLLTAPLTDKVDAHMIRNMAVLKPDDSLLEASEVFARHKFLALPVVDEYQHLVGVVDVGLMSDKIFDLAEREQMEEIFETIGFRVSQVREASPVRAFRFRFPWLLATIVSGTMCAVLTSAFALTLEKSIVLAFFLTLILGLGESVSIQSMTVAIQALRTKPTMRWYLTALRREALTALLLGAGCGILVAIIVYVWRGVAWEAVSIGSSIVLALLTACVFGLSIPSLLHAFRLDPKIAAGPITLAFTDICTLLFYFGLAWWLL
jgi:magnesium transporter